MGVYINPGNDGFTDIVSDGYVDKTDFIATMNGMLSTMRKLACVSRPRRFGKSFAAQALIAYYSCGCDSASLFDNLAISRDESFRTHLNSYNVVQLDISAFTGTVGARVVPEVTRRLLADIRSEFPELDCSDDLDLALLEVVKRTGRKFVFVVDEWDAVIREGVRDTAAQQEYLKFLRLLFKNATFTSTAIAGAYLTGILPIKKDGSQSAVSDFIEYTVLDPGDFAESLGFTAQEVAEVCGSSHVSPAEMKRWYDGYTFGNAKEMYNPNSVMRAARSGRFASYWTQTTAADGLMSYVTLDFDGMSRCIADLLGGNDVQVDTSGFANDFETFRSRDDVLTLLAHLGYLTYDADSRTACIPNEELRIEFARVARSDTRSETVRRVRESDQLIESTVAGDEQAVASAIQRIHDAETAPLFYNNEQALRSVIKLAYFCYKDQYLQFEELAGGIGFADVVYLPKKRSPYPALVIELKWNADADTAIEQIRRKRYPEALEGFGGDILLVGVSYNKDAPAGERTHTCRIERA